MAAPRRGLSLWPGVVANGPFGMVHTKSSPKGGRPEKPQQMGFPAYDAAWKKSGEVMEVVTVSSSSASGRGLVRDVQSAVNAASALGAEACADTEGDAAERTSMGLLGFADEDIVPEGVRAASVRAAAPCAGDPGLGGSDADCLCPGAALCYPSAGFDQGGSSAPAGLGENGIWRSRRS